MLSIFYRSLLYGPRRNAIDENGSHVRNFLLSIAVVLSSQKIVILFFESNMKLKQSFHANLNATCSMRSFREMAMSAENNKVFIMQ